MDQTETKQFKRWFGDSKVVDEEGDPLVVYHGTEDDLRYLTHGKPIMETFQRDTVSLQTKRTDMRIAHRIMQTGIKMVM